MEVFGGSHSYVTIVTVEHTKCARLRFTHLLTDPKCIQMYAFIGAPMLFRNNHALLKCVDLSSLYIHTATYKVD